MRLAPGSILGRYEIVAPLGAGGMGEVYRAHDARLRRDVAIKVVREPSDTSDGWLDRFHREARAASALNHPHICAVYDAGEADGRPFLVMELVEGKTLREILGDAPPDVRTTIEFAAQIADALEAAHTRGVVHRDIKPENIVVGDRGQLKVLDFGLAKHLTVSDAAVTSVVSRTGSIVGTPHYMAPEVLRGQRGDVRSDIWALGVVLYEMLAGQRPFRGESAFDAAAAILHEPPRPVPPEVPDAVRAIVSRCLAKDPDQRFQQAGKVRIALEGVQAGGKDTPVRSRAGRGAAILAAGILVIVAGVVAVRLAGGRTGGARTVTGAPASAVPEANDAFTLAMQFTTVQNDLLRGQEKLAQALVLDPHFAEARRYHAFYDVVQILNGFTNDTRQLYKAEEELRQAERDDPSLASLPSAFTALYLVQGRKDMIPAAALNRAAEVASTARDAILWQAIQAWLRGESETVKGLVGRILERDPLLAPARLFFGETLRNQGDVAGAIREHQRVLEQAPRNISAVFWLTLAYLDAGDLERAHALLENQRATFGRNYLWRTARALVLACEGQRGEAIDAMDGDTQTFARSVFVATLPGAEFYAVIGDREKALEWVDAAVRNGDERVQWFRRNPRLASIRDDARFQRMLQSIETRRGRSR